MSEQLSKKKNSCQFKIIIKDIKAKQSRNCFLRNWFISMENYQTNIYIKTCIILKLWNISLLYVFYNNIYTENEYLHTSS